MSQGLKQFSIHMIHKNKFIRYLHTNQVPRVGDTLRTDAKTFWKVTEVVWCFDEPNSQWQRVNINVEKD